MLLGWSAGAASGSVDELRLAASACGSCHTVSLIMRPEAQSAYSSAAQEPLASASRGTAMSPYQATASSPLDSMDGSTSIGVTRTPCPPRRGASRSNTSTA
jgi:hypothetical protein